MTYARRLAVCCHLAVSAVGDGGMVGVGGHGRGVVGS